MLSIDGKRHTLPIEEADLTADARRPAFPPKPAPPIPRFQPQLIATFLDPSSGVQVARVDLGSGVEDYHAGVPQNERTLLWAKHNIAFFEDGGLLLLELVPEGTGRARKEQDERRREAASSRRSCGTR
jgi:hypothetical protein